MKIINDTRRTKTGIYKILDTTTGKYYIGSTEKSFDSRFSSHKYMLKGGRHTNTHLQNIYNKRPDSLQFQILEEVSRDKCQEVEQQYINEHFDNKLCINIAKQVGGGDIRAGHSPARKAKSIEKQMATKLKNGTVSPWLSNPNNKDKCLKAAHKANTGAKRSAAAKQKMREAKLGTTRSDEAKRKTSETLKAKHAAKAKPFDLYKDGDYVGTFTRQKDVYHQGIMSNVSISELCLGKKEKVKGFTIKWIK